MKIGRVVRVLAGKEKSVIISIFYPAISSWKPEKQALYSDLFIPSQDRFINGWISKGVDKDYIKSLTANIYNDAPMDMEDKVYPVILYSPGCTFDRDSSMFSTVSLVKEGYIVITIGSICETEFTVLTNGEIIEIEQRFDKSDYTYDDWYELREIRKKDIISVLNQLDDLNNKDNFIKGKLDLSHIGVMGFSLGAVAAFEAAADDKRIKAVVLLEGCMFFSTVDSRLSRNEELSAPLLLIKRHDSTYQQMVDKTKGWYEDLGCSEYLEELKLIADISKTQQQLYAYLSGYKSFVKILYSDHVTFSDYYILTNKKNIEYCGGRIAVKDAHEVISEAAIRFFNELLRGKEGEYKGYIHEETKHSALRVINAAGEIL